jgi:predicted nuclease with TOPRIM domain
MTRSREPDDRELDRTLRSFDRRISRLEDTQVTWRELNGSFDRVYEDIDALKVEMNRRFDRLEGRFDRLEARFDRLEARFDGFEGRFGELERKFDIVMRHITGQGN